MSDRIHTFDIGDVVHLYPNAHPEGECCYAYPKGDYLEGVVISLRSRFGDEVIVANEKGGISSIPRQHATFDKYTQIVGSDKNRASMVAYSLKENVNFKFLEGILQ